MTNTNKSKINGFGHKPKIYDPEGGKGKFITLCFRINLPSHSSGLQKTLMKIADEDSDALP